MPSDNTVKAFIAVSRFTMSETLMRGDGDALFDFMAQSISLFLEEHSIGE